VSPHPLWKDRRPPDEAWRPPKGWVRAERIAEQDVAAGGQSARQIRLPRGHRAHASIALRVHPKGRRIYAYLRWSVSGKTYERYVGEVDHGDRLANLTQAWRTAHDAGLLDMETPNEG
jgi:DNA mismatch endonuclease (patch repair protein)